MRIDINEQLREDFNERVILLRDNPEEGNLEEFTKKSNESRSRIIKKVKAFCGYDENLKNELIDMHCNDIVDTLNYIAGIYYNSRFIDGNFSQNYERLAENLDYASNIIESHYKKIKSLVKQEKRNQKISDLKIKFIKFAKPKSKTQSNAQEKLSGEKTKEQDK